MGKLNFNTPAFWKSGGIGLMVTAAVWTIWAMTKTPVPLLVPIFALILTINGFLFFQGVPEGLKYWGLILVTGNFFYLTTEAFFNLAVYKSWLKPEYYWPTEELGVPLFPYFDRNCATYDSSRGFRWTAPARSVKIANGKVIFDHSFKPNNRGFISNKDYTFKKNDSTVFRWMVLGDSYTDGYYLDTSWPDKTNQLLGDSVPHELYSFGLNGGGITNWNAIFFNEIVPNYEFDGIILGIFGNDLARDLFIFDHRSPWMYFGWKGGISTEDPRNITEIRPLLDSLPLVKTREFIDNRISEISGKGINRPNLFLLTKIVNFMRAKSAIARYDDEMHKIYSKELAFSNKDENLPYNLDAYSREFGSKYSKKLADIISYAKTHNKKIILTTIPELPGLDMVRRKNPPVLQAKIRGLAKNLNTEYFDGYNAMVDGPENTLWELFLTFDGHWSQKGSDIFAKKFSEFLIEKGDSLLNRKIEK